MNKVIYCTNPNSEGSEDIPNLIRDLFDFRPTIVTNRQELREALKFGCDLLVSDRTSFILSKTELEACTGAYNIHPSLLPLHKGSFPLFWTCIYLDPLYVSLHKMECTIDTGIVVDRYRVDYSEEDTFRDVYSRYRKGAAELSVSLLRKAFSGVEVLEAEEVDNKDIFVQNVFAGEWWHRDAPTRTLLKKLTLGWDTPICLARQELFQDLADYKESVVKMK